MAHTVCELLWLKSLLQELKVLVEEPMRLYCDNRAASHIASNPVFHERTINIFSQRIGQLPLYKKVLIETCTAWEQGRARTTIVACGYEASAKAFSGCLTRAKRSPYLFFLRLFSCFYLPQQQDIFPPIRCESIRVCCNLLLGSGSPTCSCWECPWVFLRASQYEVEEVLECLHYVLSQ